MMVFFEGIFGACYLGFGVFCLMAGVANVVAKNAFYERGRIPFSLFLFGLGALMSGLGFSLMAGAI